MKLVSEKSQGMEVLAIVDFLAESKNIPPKKVTIRQVLAETERRISRGKTIFEFADKMANDLVGRGSFSATKDFKGVSITVNPSLYVNYDDLYAEIVKRFLNS